MTPEEAHYALQQRDEQLRKALANIQDYEKKFTEMDFTIGKALEEAHQYRDKLAEAHQQLAQAQAVLEEMKVAFRHGPSVALDVARESTALEEKCQRLEAEAAAMRLLLQNCREDLNFIGDIRPLLESTTAGKELLERMKRWDALAKLVPQPPNAITWEHGVELLNKLQALAHPRQWGEK